MTQTVNPNQEQARELRERTRRQGLRHFIGGEWVDSRSGETFETHTPTDNSVLATVASGDAADIDRAARAAYDAFGQWREVSGQERRKLLHRVADLIEARAQEIALLESVDTGQAIRFMKSAAARGAENFRFFADRAPSAADGQSLPAPGFLNYTLRQPIGPVGVITPWNTPFMLSTWKIAPALAAGCTVVHKPAEWSPVTATLLAEIMDEAGLPRGVVNLVHGYGETAGKALTEHPLIKAIAFVGETTTGSLIMRQGADTLKRVHFELGGKNPVVVFDDADLDKALDAVVFMIYSLNGERCTSSSRVLIQEGIYDEFTARIAERAKNIRVGDPLNPNTEIGPLVHPRHFEKVMSYFDKAREDGATIAAGGERVGEDGNFVSATLFTGARNDMRIAQEEIFGPVLTAIPFRDEADALALANGVKYGLAGYLWTNDLTRAHRFAQALEAGMVWVNSENVRHLPTPFGGVKDSGIGRDGGDYSFDFYMETKNIAISLGTHKTAKLGVGQPVKVDKSEVEG
ncbi:5-carboxymethyl-2-hydroxymuconate semialdehyde dehydrogenase (plasmid) [Deinococcus metallilatus]|uniref:5-carboxymethyl-2-hydroxymuconate semialdehyde dehydrogenase n=1 Tax=Deinococcus metallilatus TaxID=1211322 RepID=A0AAJ5F9L7_9DEIO|nr:5-carboxymethyl-2-hydroxymuconate semialdehyde dehydrogenase [Deinococcus metallilatus]MBB5293275.1 5-carboxymethyl-2-hydroxymuconic-semialdehyde dehydrogenase [Deinococcus metallilatus]QBY07055.1 5-carboxymethyl-2-hydroxymuconate semialdehyde dehydrogenase [Deinococcus metallilatus]RXJ18066.1 5-carboxymethyl-2-hydroxymuconate semialdehyde dehydrogenase [Deinococcus metallilatus]TLK32002.1 5-carboxymethyl-2-hydroxymuconate semialdehyde dehydrogenase [Deinococcus metallilatus]GMA15502.1 alde